MVLEDILGQHVYENAEVECKARLDRENVQGWLKTVGGFANAEGGTFYIGVEDKSNKLIGFDRRDADNERNFFNNQINEHVSPRPNYTVNFLPYSNKGKERYILVVRIQESSVKPVVVKFKGVPAIYMRRQGMTNGATYEEIIQMSIHSHGVQYDVLPSSIPYSASNFSKLFAFCAERNGGENILTEKRLTSLGFFTGEGYLKNGAVLFSDGYADGKTEIQCSVFSGFSRGSERIVTVNRFSGSITEDIEYIVAYVRQRMNHSMIKTNDAHINIDAFPVRSLFEAAVNAVAHRDYFMDGTQIQVDIFRDRLEISSPGGFYQRESLKRTYDLSSLISIRRNELICNVLVACNAMEAAGTGFEKIAEDYADADAKHKPYIYSASDHFTLVLPDLTYENGVRDDGVPALEFMPIPNGTKHDRDILEFCYNSAKSAKDIAQYINLSDSSYFRATVLQNLCANGYLDITKYGRSKLYRTNRSAVRLG